MDMSVVSSIINDLDLLKVQENTWAWAELALEKLPQEKIEDVVIPPGTGPITGSPVDIHLKIDLTLLLEQNGDPNELLKQLAPFPPSVISEPLKKAIIKEMPKLVSLALTNIREEKHQRLLSIKEQILLLLNELEPEVTK